MKTIVNCSSEINSDDEKYRRKEMSEQRVYLQSEEENSKYFHPGKDLRRKTKQFSKKKIIVKSFLSNSEESEEEISKKVITF